MPVNTARSGIGSRPWRWPRRLRRWGISGATSAQRSSSNSGRAMPDRTKPFDSMYKSSETRSKPRGGRATVQVSATAGTRSLEGPGGRGRMPLWNTFVVAAPVA